MEVSVTVLKYVAGSRVTVKILVGLTVGIKLVQINLHMEDAYDPSDVISKFVREVNA